MSVSIDIVPFSVSLDMYGQPDTSSAYSLSGHVSISISPTASLFDSGRRTIRLFLQSLTVTFEGQSEVINSEFGYAPLRLCSITHELVPSEAVELSNEGHEESNKPCKWNVVFNLPIPGWLPASERFGEQFDDEYAGTRYALYASANLVNLDNNNDKTWSLASFCSIFRPRTRMIRAQQCPITLRRLTIPPSIPLSPESLFPMANYTVLVTPEFSDLEDGSSQVLIPRHILSKIEVVTSVPENNSLDDSSVPFSIRFRTSELEDAERKRLQIMGFTVDVEQTESYRALPPADSASHFPIPPISSQPPNKPLLCPHSFIRIYQSGLVTASADPNSTLSRSFSINPKEAGNYSLAGDNYIFASDHASPNPSWHTITTSIPIARRASSESYALRASGSSPLFGVHHDMHIAVTCKYDAPNSNEPIIGKLYFSVPLHFSEITPMVSLPGCSTSRPTSVSTSYIASSEPLSQPEMVPYTLPAYSQLFDSNGDRKIDYSLPVYTPPARSSPVPSDLEAAAHSLPEGKQLFTILDE